MTVLSTDTRNAACLTVTSRAEDGTLRLRSSAGVTLCDIPIVGFATPVEGVAACLGGDGENPISEENPLEGVGASGAGSGTACTNYQVLTSEGAVCWSGSVGTSDDDADLIVPNVSIASGQPVRLNNFSHTQPA